MPRKKRQRYFVPKELRYSIAFIVIWSLLAGVVLIYLAKALGGLIHQNVLPFVLIMAGYAAVVVIFTMIFSHRFIGPFERLKLQMRLILSGDYERRLQVRKNDDVYIRSFIGEVNNLLDSYERKHRSRAELAKGIDSELIDLVSILENKGLTREDQIEQIARFHSRVKEMVKVSP